jgi:hypothetical protein
MTTVMILANIINRLLIIKSQYFPSVSLQKFSLMDLNVFNIYSFKQTLNHFLKLIFKEGIGEDAYLGMPPNKQ